MRTLKSLLLTSAMLLPLSITSFAADVITEQPPEPIAPTLIAPHDSNNWAGGYIGASLGYSLGRLKISNISLSNSTQTMSDYSFKANDFHGEAFAGWNFQTDNIVYGIEGDAGYSGIKKESGIANISVRQTFLGSLRGRLGFVVSDPVLTYLTAGVAGTEIKFGDGITNIEKFRTGWTIGVGADALFSENIIGRAEYRYIAFGKKDYNLTGISFRSEASIHDIRLGIGYKF